MVDPISAGLAIGSSVLKGVAGLRAGKQQKKALYAQAREDEMAGNAQALEVRNQARAAIGQQVAAQFSNGFQGGTGSALDALAESQINATLDVMETRRQALAKARAERAEGNMRSQQGKFALAEGLIGAASKGLQMQSDWAAASAGRTPPTRGKTPDDITVTRGR